jgi:DNA repair photolyase
MGVLSVAGLRLGEVRCRGILSHSGIGGMDYAVNPYLGCGHGCTYCYARFMTRFGHVGEEWGSFVDAKVNAVERLTVEAPRKRRGRVILSSVTDPYQPIERRYRLTRGAIGVLSRYGYAVDILTKSDLVLRDLDLIAKIDEVEVGLTITSLDDRVRRAFEPGASTVQARLDALKKLSDAGLPTYAFIGPMLPYLSDENLNELLDILADRVNRLIVDRLNIKCGNMPFIRRVLDAHFPDLVPQFESAVAEGSAYYAALRGRVAEMCRERSIRADIIF